MYEFISSCITGLANRKRKYKETKQLKRRKKGQSQNKGSEDREEGENVKNI